MVSQPTLSRLTRRPIHPTGATVTTAESVKRALAYQHVRLQLLRATVKAELHSLAGVPLDENNLDEESARQKTRKENLETSIDLFELDHLMNRRIDELSGGEQGVSLLVLDEPLAGLDAAGRADLAVTLDRVRLAGTSIVAVSHDIEWAPPHVTQRLRLADGTLEVLT